MSLRFFTRFEITDIYAFIIDQGNPFNIVFFFHRMNDRADLNFQMVVNLLDTRYVFFLCCINRASDEMRQFLACINDFFRCLCADDDQNFTICIIAVKFNMLHINSSSRGLYPSIKNKISYII